MKIGLIGAVPEEIQLFESLLETKEKKMVGNSELTIGKFNEHEIVVAFTRCGKVSAANMASILIHVLNVDIIVFIGIAGGTDPKLSVGDVIIADELIQYDINPGETSPYKKFEIPLLEIDRIKAKPKYTAFAEKVIKNFLKKELVNNKEFQAQLKELDLDAPQVISGLIGTADQFVTEKQKIDWLMHELPDLRCVEMEGAAIAQICYCHEVPFLVIRIISDHADENAQRDFQIFISKIGKYLIRNIAKEIIMNL